MVARSCAWDLRATAGRRCRAPVGGVASRQVCGDPRREFQMSEANALSHPRLAHEGGATVHRGEAPLHLEVADSSVRVVGFKMPLLRTVEARGFTCTSHVLRGACCTRSVAVTRRTSGRCRARHLKIKYTKLRSGCSSSGSDAPVSAPKRSAEQRKVWEVRELLATQSAAAAPRPQTLCPHRARCWKARPYRHLRGKGLRRGGRKDQEDLRGLKASLAQHTQTGRL